MARGDIISIDATSLSNQGYIDIRPASGVEWNIRFMTATGTFARFHVNSGNYELRTSTEAGGTSESNDADQAHVTNHGPKVNLYLTNAQGFKFYGTTASGHASYLGVQTK